MHVPQLLADRFEVETLIAKGGMGSVYRGRDRHTGEPVAVKVLQAEVFAHDPAVLERFVLEGEALRRLNHPNIVKMLTAISERDEHYLVLEYIEGGSLRDLLDRERQLSVEATLSIALELVDALTRCHHLNIIHRDIKPENVLLASDGTPRLTDFGIAHVNESALTQPGEVVGTYAYLAPESLRGELLDARADLWAFGVMIFEMLTGQQPFVGDNLAALINAILTCPVPDLEALRSDVPTALVDLIYRMLEKNRDERIPTARLVAAELENILRGGATGIHTVRRDSKRATALDDILVPITLDSTTPLTQLHNLPAQTSAFVGREDELAEITRLLATDTIRLLTILGPGGMGKTRLALEAAAQQLNNYRDGVYFVDLAPLIDPAQIVTTIADAIQFSFYKDVPPTQQLLDYLREKHMLLLLDNFEHLISSAALVANILKAAANVKILVTSRERLDLSAETLLNISGLDFPTWETPEDALTYAAVKLFLQSARRAKPSFELTADMLTPVSRICRQVSGMPLGIVLAAAWVDMLSLDEIAAEIERSLDFLETEMRDLPTRQRSLRAVFAYSWALLSSDEQAAFQRLAIFRGGFTREAAHAVSDASLRTLAALVNQSLLQRRPDGRYAIHELLRQYAESRLIANPTEAMQTRSFHSAYYAAYLTDLEQQLYAGHELEVLAGVEIEFDNIRLAWDWAVAQRNREEIEAALICLWWVYSTHHRYDEAKAQFSAAETILRANEIPERGWSLLLAKLVTIKGSFEDAKVLIDLLKVVAEDSLESEMGFHFNILIANILYEGEQQEEFIQQQARKCLALTRDRNRPWELAYTCLKLGMMIGRAGQNWDETVRLMEESLMRFRALSAPWGVTLAARWCSNNHFLQGDYLAAYQHSQEALRLSQMQPDRLLIAHIYQGIGLIWYELGDYAQMGACYQEALTIIRELGHAEWTAFFIGEMSSVSIAVGDFDQAESWIRQALAIHHIHEHELLLFAHEHYIYIALAKNDRDSLQEHFAALTGLVPPEDRDGEFYTYMAGKVMLAHANYAAAIQHFEEMLRTYPPDRLHHLRAFRLSLLGRALSGAGRYSEAEQRFQQAWQHISAEGLQDRTDALCAIAELLAAEGRDEAFEIASLVAQHPASIAETRLRATRLLSLRPPSPPPLPDSLPTLDSLSAWILAEDGSGLVR